MANDDDDPYLAELLDLVKDDDVKPNGSSSSSATASSSQLATNVMKPASTVVSSPSQYHDSDIHRETLKLLLQLSPAGANLPTAEDVQKAFRTLYPPFQAPQQLINLDDNDEKVFEVSPPTVSTGGARKERTPPIHLDAVQEELEEHLGATDLFALRDVIRAQVDAWHAGKRALLEIVAAKEQERKNWTEEEEKKKEAAKQKQQQRKTEKEAMDVDDKSDEDKEQLNGLSQSQLSQSQASQDDVDIIDKKRKRGTGVVGGRATLPLRLPKAVSDSSTSRSFLVELDERDKAQDLTGDSGAVGRVHVEKKKGIILDLKGHQYLAHLRRCPTLLLVSVGDEEAKVEDVVETLCVLTHQHDQLKEMGGKVVSRAAGEIKGEEGGEGGGYESEHYRPSDDSENEGKKKGGGEGGRRGGWGGGGKTVANKRSSGGGGAKKGKCKGGKGVGGGGGGGGSRKSMGSSLGAGKGKKASASSKRQGPRKVSLRALKQQKKVKQQKGGGYDDDDSEDEEEDEEESFQEPDDDDDSDCSI